MKELLKYLAAGVLIAALWATFGWIETPWARAGREAGEAAAIEISTPNGMELTGAVESAAYRLVLDRHTADKPGASPAAAVDYSRALEGFDQAVVAAEVGGIPGFRIDKAKERGEVKARQFLAELDSLTGK